MADNDWFMVEGSEWVMVDRSDSESPSRITMVIDLPPNPAVRPVISRPEHLSEEFLQTIRAVGIDDYEIQAESADEFCSLLLEHVFKGWQSDKPVPGHNISIQQEAAITLDELKAGNERVVGEYAVRVGTWPRRLEPGNRFDAYAYVHRVSTDPNAVEAKYFISKPHTHHFQQIGASDEVVRDVLDCWSAMNLIRNYNQIMERRIHELYLHKLIR